MATDPFVWGAAGRRMTPDEVATERKLAAALMTRASDTSPVGHWTGALNRALLGMMAGYDDYRAGESAKANAGESASLVQALLGGGATSSAAPAPAPPAVSGAATGAASTAAVPDNISQIIAQNVPPELQSYATNLIGKESSFRPDAVSPTGATGLAQFTRGTGKQYGLVTDEGDFRADPVRNVQALVALTNDNRQALTQALGRAPTDGELALAHQQGAQGAINLLSGRPVPSQNLAVNGVDPNADPRAAAQKIMAYYGGSGGSLPNLPAGDGAMNAADQAGLLSGKTSPVLAFNGNPQDLMSPDRPYTGPVPTDMNDAARQGLLSGMTPPRVDAPAQQPMPASFEEAPGAAPQASRAAPQQIAQALVAPQQGVAAPASPRTAAAPQASPVQGAPTGLNPAIVKAMSSPYVSDQVRKIGTLLFQNTLQQQGADAKIAREIQARQNAARAAGIDPSMATDPEIWKQAVTTRFGAPATATVGRAIIDTRTGRPIYQGQEDTPTSVREYEYARRNGYTGSYNEFSNQKTQRQFQAVQVQDGNGNTRTMFYNPQTNRLQTQEEMGVAPAGGPSNPYATGGKQTEQQGNAVGFANRMVDAHNEINQLESVGTSAMQSGLASVPGVGNYLTSADKQKLDQAQRNFVNAILRKESGAAISKNEFENAAKQYFPQPGDTPEVIAQKRANRIQSIKGIMAVAGPNYKPPASFRPDGDEPVKVNSPAEARKLPSGTKIRLPDGSTGVVP